MRCSLKKVITGSTLGAAALISPLSTPVLAQSFSVLTQQADFELTQPLMVANVLDEPGKEIIAIGVDNQQQRWMAIYSLSPSGQDIVLHDKVNLTHDLFRYDVNTDAKDSDIIQPIYFLNAEGVLKYQPPEGSINELIADSDPQSPQTCCELTPTLDNKGVNHGRIVQVAELNSIAVLPKADFISRGKFVKNINDDAYADLIISDFRATHLLLGTQSGEFARQSLPILPIVELTSTGAEYSQSDIYISDMNMDGLHDIVTVEEGMLGVFYQQTSGLFASHAEFLPVSQPISGVDWWNKRDAYGRQLDQSDLLYRKVEQLSDINGDELTDLVVRYTKSSGVFDRSNDYEVYLGQKDEQTSRLTFSKSPSSVIRAEGTLTGLSFIDLDNDKRQEVLVSGFDIGVTQVVGALLSGSIDQDVYLFKMDDKSQYPDKANISQQVELSFSLTSGQSGEPVVTTGDIDGDGFKELVLSDDDSGINILWGQTGSKPFSGNKSQSLILPKEGSMLSLHDVNQDGKDDIIIHYGRQDPKTVQRQFTVMLSQ